MEEVWQAIQAAKEQSGVPITIGHFLHTMGVDLPVSISNELHNTNLSMPSEQVGCVESNSTKSNFEIYHENYRVHRLQFAKLLKHWIWIHIQIQIWMPLWIWDFKWNQNLTTKWEFESQYSCNASTRSVIYGRNYTWEYVQFKITSWSRQVQTTSVNLQFRIMQKCIWWSGWLMKLMTGWPSDRLVDEEVNQSVENAPERLNSVAPKRRIRHADVLDIRLSCYNINFRFMMFCVTVYANGVNASSGRGRNASYCAPTISCCPFNPWLVHSTQQFFWGIVQQKQRRPLVETL